NRAFTTVTPFTCGVKLQPLPISQLQRRFASEEAQTRSEPPADRAEEGQHGDNSIAASSQESQSPAQGSRPSPSEETSKAGEAAAANEQSSQPQPAGSEQPSTVGELASAAAEKTKEAASSALGAVTGGYGSRDSSFQKPEPPPNQTVYVGNLFFDVREDDLRREFEKMGAIESVKLIMDNRGLSKGFGYITFTSQEAATEAIQVYNNQPFEGRRLTVQYAAQRAGASPLRTRTEPSPPSRTLFIGNMAFDMSDRELNNLFREIRNVVDVRVAIDRRTGQPRGFAHADFTDVESAKEALLALSGREVCNRTLRVDYSQTSGRRMQGGDQEQQRGY
ncbi:MAG: hypothetical protein LQ338_008341, partial [Usnochroma carphineum]